MQTLFPLGADASARTSADREEPKFFRCVEASRTSRARSQREKGSVETLIVTKEPAYVAQSA